jgi:hypothetical protein
MHTPDPFRQLRYLTSPEASVQADPERASLESSTRAARRLIVDKGSLR